MAAGGWLRSGTAAVVGFLDFYAGVFALVALSLSVMIGLAATDRLMLSARHRVLMQMVHRAAAFTALAMLVLHVLTKIVDGRVGMVAALVPYQTVALGLGTAAGYLMILLVAGGIARGRFAAGWRPEVWRGVHCLAYVTWPLAIGHGLTSGRTPADWVTASYALCLGIVVLALPARLITKTRRPR